MGKVDHEQTALNLIDSLVAGLEKHGWGASADQTIELIKVHAMLAQARAQENLAAATWAVSTSLDGIGQEIRSHE